MSRQINRNEKCPCRSGQKYKRCCLPAGRAWSEDEDGRFLPDALFRLGPGIRRPLINTIEEAGRLDELIFGTDVWEDITVYRAISMLTVAQRADVLLQSGMGPPVVLFVERTGYLPYMVVWHHWEKTGYWIIHPKSSVRHRETVMRGLEAVVAAYPYLPEDEGAPTPCAFREGTLILSERFGPVELSPVDDEQTFDLTNPFPLVMT